MSDAGGGATKAAPTPTRGDAVGTRGNASQVAIRTSGVAVRSRIQPAAGRKEKNDNDGIVVTLEREKGQGRG